MEKEILWLRVSFWWGIIADAVMAVFMLAPQLFTRFVAGDIVPDAEFSYGLRYGAPLMIGWTLLLLWADRRPVARKDVLLLTLPVVLGYALLQIYAVRAGFATLSATAPLWVSQIGMSALFVFSYRRARNLG